MARSVGWPYKKEFQCHRCGNCCRGDGYVDMTESDVSRAAHALGIGDTEFLATYAHTRGDTVVLRDQEDDLQSCIFLTVDDAGLHGCRIHGAKPAQCAGFPFAWRPRDAVSYCEGLRALEGLPARAPRKTMSARNTKPAE